MTLSGRMPGKWTALQPDPAVWRLDDDAVAVLDAPCLRRLRMDVDPRVGLGLAKVPDVTQPAMVVDVRGVRVEEGQRIPLEELRCGGGALWRFHPLRERAEAELLEGRVVDGDLVLRQVRGSRDSRTEDRDGGRKAQGEWPSVFRANGATAPRGVRAQP